MIEEDDGNPPGGMTRRLFVGLSTATVVAAAVGSDVLWSSTPSHAAGGYRQPFDEQWFIPPDGEWGNTAAWRSFPPHAGVDYNIVGRQTRGTVVRAIGAGTIRGKGWSGTYGNRVWVQHDDGWWSHYAHMDPASSRSNGERVNAGDPLGLVGNTGSASAGNHLHLEVSQTQLGCHKHATSVNPITFINNNGGGGAQPAPDLSPIHRRNNNMASLFHLQNFDGTHTWALAGDGVGSAAWLEISDVNVANGLSLQHGAAVTINWDTWQIWKAAYLSRQPVATA